MNGISLAALLGAATWFGPTASNENIEEAARDAASEPTPPKPDERPADQYDDQYEFIWPPNPLYQ